jgi:hypothetical protein
VFKKNWLSFATEDIRVKIFCWSFVMDTDQELDKSRSLVSSVSIIVLCFSMKQPLCAASHAQPLPVSAISHATAAIHRHTQPLCAQSLSALPPTRTAQPLCAMTPVTHRRYVHVPSHKSCHRCAHPPVQSCTGATCYASGHAPSLRPTSHHSCYVPCHTS